MTDEISYAYQMPGMRRDDGSDQAALQPLRNGIDGQFCPVQILHAGGKASAVYRGVSPVQRFHQRGGACDGHQLSHGAQYDGPGAGGFGTG